MRTSSLGIALIKKFEGKFLTAYHGVADRPGLLTIGYGHTDAAGPPKVKAGMVLTEQQAEDILRSDLRSVELAVERLVKVPLKQNELDALVSFTYNVGEGALGRSTLLRRLNSGDYDVANEFMKYTKANGVPRVQGLVNRRKAEADLWNRKSSSTQETTSGSIIAGTGAVVAMSSPAEYLPYIIGTTIVLAGVLFLCYKLYKSNKDKQYVKKTVV